MKFLPSRALSGERERIHFPAAWFEEGHSIYQKRETGRGGGRGEEKRALEGGRRFFRALGFLYGFRDSK